VARAIPVFFLAGGELFLAAVALRIAVWVVRGWRDWGALVRSAGAGDDPRGPGGGLRLVPRRDDPEPPGWRLAA
jgi:hypothetical protein